MTVRHRLGSYEIAYSALEDVLPRLPDSSFFLTDENVFRLHGDGLDPRRTLILPPGEGTKSIGYLERALEWLADQGASRGSTLVAFGGGVVGDLAGFVASSYMRGIEYVQIPTTLLAQVDSSVGGKVGIDLKAGKNLAGAFYPPASVYICLELLDTLDDRQFNNGMAEVWKYGFIADPALLGAIREGGTRASDSQLKDIVGRCIEIKAQIVAEDEFEKTGLRATLNYGHTVGHAIERITNYIGPLHGEAISIGMVVEAKLGEILGITEKGVARSVRDLLEGQGLPVAAPASIQAADLVQSMRGDKKRTSKGLAFSLLTQLGQCKLVQDVAEKDVERVLSSV